MIKKLREPVNGLTHFFAAISAAIGLAVMLFFGHDSLGKIISLTIYGVSLILMFSASATYHMVKAQPAVILRLRKLDHSAIYLLIAGTYTPICLYFFQGFWQWGLLSIVWVLALIGIIVKLFVIRASRWFTAGVYLVMGWLSIFAIREMVTRMPAGALIWLLAGGIFFTIGAIFYIIKKPNFFPGVFGFHEVWHIFVILGCVCHFVVIAFFIAPGVG